MVQACFYQPVTKWGRTTEPILLRLGRNDNGIRLDRLMCLVKQRTARDGLLLDCSES